MTDAAWTEGLADKQIAAVQWKAQLMVDSMTHPMTEAERSEEINDIAGELAKESAQGLAATVQAHGNYLASKFNRQEMGAGPTRFSR